MNTHDKYELPPLPEPTYRSPSGTGNYFDGYTKQTLQAYATAAIEPYAKRIAALEAARIAYASEFPPNEDGDPDVDSIHENIRKLKADRQTRGEPVAWLRSDELRKLGYPYSDAPLNSKTDSMMLHAKGTQEAAAKYGHDVPVFTTPQPQQVPEGYKLVPIEPTPKMKTAGIGVEVYQESKPETGALTWAEAKEIYKAMIEAAPEPKEKP